MPRTDLAARRTVNAAQPKRWFFDAWSRVYDMPLVQRATYRPVQDTVIEALAQVAHSRVLDIGCGTGLLTCRIIETFPRTRVIGCDFSSGMLARAAARGPSVCWVQGDGCRLPFTDRAFDAIVSTEAFHWFPDQAAALAEFFRVLTPGGRLFLALMNTPAAPLSAALHFGSLLLGEPFYWPSNRQMREWVEAAGFRIERRQRVFRFPGLLLPPVLTCAVRPTHGGANLSAPRRERLRVGPEAIAGGHPAPFWRPKVRARGLRRIQGFRRAVTPTPRTHRQAAG